jgi:hypothetical protein
MDPDEEILEDRPEPGWKERVGAVRRAASALFTTRAAIFREELSHKGSLFAKGAAGLLIAAGFGFFALLLLTALVAAVFARLLGGPIAGITAALILYLAIAAAAALLGAKTLQRMRGFAFPATRDEIRWRPRERAWARKTKRATTKMPRKSTTRTGKAGPSVRGESRQ